MCKLWGSLDFLGWRGDRLSLHSEERETIWRQHAFGLLRFEGQAVDSADWLRKLEGVGRRWWWWWCKWDGEREFETEVFAQSASLSGWKVETLSWERPWRAIFELESTGRCAEEFWHRAVAVEAVSLARSRGFCEGCRTCTQWTRDLQDFVSYSYNYVFPFYLFLFFLNRERSLLIKLYLVWCSTILV